MSTITETPNLTGSWNLDPVHSSVGFEIAYLAGTFKGEFDEVAARLTVEADSGRLEGSAQVASVDVKDENLNAHLQSPDFFDAERHPELRFTADAIDLSGVDVATSGELTIKGATRPVEVTGTVAAPIVDAYGNDRIGLRLTATVDRAAFGVSWNTELPSGAPALADSVRIVADLQLVRSA
jgi:polyisoprenoid-binding protein YceI